MGDFFSDSLRFTVSHADLWHTRKGVERGGQEGGSPEPKHTSIGSRSEPRKFARNLAHNFLVARNLLRSERPSLPSQRTQSLLEPATVPISTAPRDVTRVCE
jgi:hypothetical protein